MSKSIKKGYVSAEIFDELENECEKLIKEGKMKPIDQISEDDIPDCFKLWMKNYGDRIYEIMEIPQEVIDKLEGEDNDS